MDQNSAAELEVWGGEVELESLYQHLREQYRVQPWTLVLVVEDTVLESREPRVLVFFYSEFLHEPVLLYAGHWFDLPLATRQEMAPAVCRQLQRLGLKQRQDYARRLSGDGPEE